MLKLQQLKLKQLNSFNSELFLVYWYIHYLVERGGTLGYDRFRMACLTLRRWEKLKN